MEQLEELIQAYYAASSINNAVAIAKCGEAFGALGTPEGDVWQVLATTYVSILKGDFAQAREQLLSSLTEISALKDERAVLRCYMSLGIASSQLDLPDAIEMYQRAIEICERRGNRAGVASAVSNIGIVHYHSFNNTQALEYFGRALDVYTELNERNGMANTLCNVGNTFSAVGDFAMALKYHLQSLELHEETGNVNNKAIVCTNIGRDYSEMRDVENAIIYGERSIELYTQTGNNSGRGVATGSLASTYSRAHQYDRSIPLHRETIEIFKATAQRRMVVMTSTNLAADLVEVGEYVEARAILQELAEADDSNADHNVIQGRAWSRIHVADTNTTDAIAALSRSLDIAVANNFRAQLPGIYLQFRELCKTTGDFEGYIRYNELHQKAEEEIRGADQLRKFEMQVAEQQMAKERHEREREREILHSTLPKAVADRVIRGEQVNDHYDNAAVLFLDIVGFTTNTSSMPPPDVVSMLETIFGIIDGICDSHNIVKIKTIGDSYMCFRGDANATTNALSMARVALDVMKHAFTWPNGTSLQFRVGIHIGPATAGVIGTQRLQYDVWGDTVNVASRMESSGEPGRIHVSETFTTALRSVDGGQWTVDTHNDSVTNDSITLLKRGTIEIKGKGPMTTYWLEGTE